MLDTLATITDAELAASRTPTLQQNIFAPLKNLTHELFRFDLYDWDLWDTIAMGYGPVELSKGYFMYVSARRISKLKRTFSYFKANVQKEPETGKILKIYAIAGGNLHPPTYVHRHLADVTDRHVIVDHFSGLSLDNRDAMLRRRTHALNTLHQDSSSRRQAHNGLKRGVYRTRSGKFSAQIKKDGANYHMPNGSLNQDEAYAWYCKKHKELFGIEFVDLALKPNFPMFPPLKGEVNGIPF